MANIQRDSAWKTGQIHDSVVSIGDPLLRSTAVDITDWSTANELFATLTNQLRQLQGAGLAAPQLGMPFAAAVIEVRKTDVFPNRPESPLITIANPKVIESSADLLEDWEGCFSIPGLMGKVARPSSLTIEFAQTDGIRRRETYTGYVARVIQHEIDPLYGTVFLDRMDSLSSLTTVQNYLNFWHNTN